MWVTERYQEHKFKKVGKYKCVCGNKFQRVETDGWTQNPYNVRWMAGDIEGLNKDFSDRVGKQLEKRSCPKCGEECLNINL